MRVPPRHRDPDNRACRTARSCAVTAGLRRSARATRSWSLTMPRGSDVRGGYIAPGYVEMHLHGANGADFMDGTGRRSSPRMRGHARHGTTSIFPTTTTGTRRRSRQMFGRLPTGTGVVDDRRRAVGGVHFSGPTSRATRSAPIPGLNRSPVPNTWLLRLGIIRIATCAAELPGAEALSRAPRAAASSHAGTRTRPGRDAAFRAGMRHVDHFWCAMSSVASLATLQHPRARRCRAAWRSSSSCTAR